jgi:glycosyltransferase involved in cell wall biosynthesis
MKKQVLPRIKVLRIISRMNIGGPAIQIAEIIKGLNNIGDFDQILVTGTCDSSELDLLSNSRNELPVFYIERFGKEINLYNDFRTLISLIRLIRVFKPHIIHTHATKAGILGRLAALLSFHRAITIHTFHGHLLYGYPKKNIIKIYIFLERLFAMTTTHLLAVGEKVRNELLSKGIGTKEKFTVMYPGVKIKQLPKRENALKKLRLTNNILYCAYIGRLTYVKRIDRLLDVIKEAKSRSLEIQFIIAGGGDQFDYAKNRAIIEALPIQFLNWQLEIEQVLSVADIVILTSDNEGMPLSLIQAGFAGIPAISTNVGSVGEVIMNHDTGIITDKNIISICNSIEYLVKNKNYRLELGKRARNYTAKNFNSQRLIKDHSQLYKNLISNQARI